MQRCHRIPAPRHRPGRGLLPAVLFLAAAFLAGCGAGNGAALRVDAVRPAAVSEAEGGLLIVTGRGFQQGARVLVGNAETGPVTWVNGRTLTAVLPAGFRAGHHEVRVVNPDGSQATWDGALSVFQVPTPTPTPTPTPRPTATPTPTERPGRDDRDDRDDRDERDNGRGRGNRSFQVPSPTATPPPRAGPQQAPTTLTPTPTPTPTASPPPSPSPQPTATPTPTPRLEAATPRPPDPDGRGRPGPPPQDGDGPGRDEDNRRGPGGPQ